MEWNPRVICCRTRDLRSRDGAGPRAASPSADVSTHSRGPPYPGLPAFSPSRTSSHDTLFFRSPYTLQTPVERSERLVGRWAVRAQANPRSLGVWRFTLRFALPGLGLATPVHLERREVTYWTQSLPTLLIEIV
jgi:hypothetical protein